MMVMPRHTRRQGAVIQFNSIRPKFTVHIYTYIYVRCTCTVFLCVFVCGADMGEDPMQSMYVLYTHSLACCLLCRRYFVLCVCCSQYDERAFSFVAVDSIVGWYVVCLSFLHQIEWFSAYLFGCSVSVSHKQVIMRLRIVRIDFPPWNALTQTLEQTQSYTRTYTGMRACKCICTCVRQIDKVNFNFIRSLSLLLALFGIDFIHIFLRLNNRVFVAVFLRGSWRHGHCCVAVISFKVANNTKKYCSQNGVQRCCLTMHVCSIVNS